MLVETKIENPTINTATYLEGYKVSIVFNDGKTSIVDFGPFLASKKSSYLKKYINPLLFKNFHIEDGNIVWGKDWDMIFPLHQLYKGSIKL